MVVVMARALHHSQHDDRCGHRDLEWTMDADHMLDILSEDFLLPDEFSESGRGFKQPMYQEAPWYDRDGELEPHVTCRLCYMRTGRNCQKMRFAWFGGLSQHIWTKHCEEGHHRLPMAAGAVYVAPPPVRNVLSEDAGAAASSRGTSRGAKRLRTPPPASQPERSRGTKRSRSTSTSRGRERQLIDRLRRMRAELDDIIDELDDE